MPSKPILIDVYEPADLKNELADIGTIVPLPTADFAWAGISGQSIGLERKDMSDLLNSFANGRLSDQLTRLVQQYDWPILLTEGFMSQTKDGTIKIGVGSQHTIRNFRYTTIQEMLLEAQMTGVFIVNSPAKWATGNLIRKLYEFSQRTDHNLLSRRIRPFQLGTKVDEQTFLLMGLPGVGEETARELLGTFGSPFFAMAQILSNETEVLKVKGLGPQKIKNAQRILRKNNNATAADN